MHFEGLTNNLTQEDKRQFALLNERNRRWANKKYLPTDTLGGGKWGEEKKSREWDTSYQMMTARAGSAWSFNAPGAAAGVYDFGVPGQGPGTGMFDAHDFPASGGPNADFQLDNGYSIDNSTL